ncbi:MAG: ABC transporter permease [Actinomycetia bacterium]|nr:ABC transporter permease [Actinomycetes bacterium]
MPGTAWLFMLFLVPVYAILATAFGNELDFFGQPIPAWNPFEWDFTVFRSVVEESLTGFYRNSWIRTFVYCLMALAICVLVGYPVAYYVARLAGRTRGLLLALILAPWWINYLTRMLAWTGLLENDGLVNQFLGYLGFGPVDWLDGNWWVVVIALAYGYLPFFIVPLYAYLDRIDQSHIEASRDLGANMIRTFTRVTLPLSRIGLLTAMVITTLPMFGDYYTNTLVSNSPSTNMIGNSIETTVLSGFSRAEGASLVILLSALLMVFMAYYLLITVRAGREA